MALRFVLFALVLAICPVPSWAEVCDDPAGTTIFLVRHAEKEAGPDPALTTEGLARAQALREVMAQVPLAAIHVTQWQRTRLTAEPVAEEKGMVMQIHSTESASLDEHVQAVVDVLLSEHCGQNVLVVGHSNTVPRIIAGLTGQPMADLDERDYDHFYQVRIRARGPAEVFRTRFGAVNHAKVE